MSEEQRVGFLSIDCDVMKESYPANGQPALQLFVADTDSNKANGWYPGEPVCTATVCLPGHPFKSGETAIKNYTENEGVLDALIDAGWIEDTGQVVPSGYADAPIVKLLR